MTYSTSIHKARYIIARQYEEPAINQSIDRAMCACVLFLIMTISTTQDHDDVDKGGRSPTTIRL